MGRVCTPSLSSLGSYGRFVGKDTPAAAYRCSAPYVLHFPQNLHRLYMWTGYRFAPVTVVPLGRSPLDLRLSGTRRLIGSPDHGMIYADTLCGEKLGLPDQAIEGLYGAGCATIGALGID
jgi:hypothetical protein